MGMTTVVEQVAGTPPIAILTLAGELDASNYEALIDNVTKAYAAGARGLVLDLTGLSFMASSGFVALFAAERIMRGDPPPDTEAGWQTIHEMEAEDARAANVRLAGVQEAVRRILDRTGLSRLFPMDQDRRAAIAALQGA